MTQRRVLVDGLVFPEAPRWHGGRLWFVDMYGGLVLSSDETGRTEVMAEFSDDEPSGIGFLPDGTPLVVLMRRRQVVRLEGSRPRVHADLTALTPGYLNDMVVNERGQAYVDCVVWRNLGDPGPECIALVEPDGTVRVAAPDLVGPNGLVLTPDARLIFASPRLGRLTEMKVGEDGSLRDPAVFAETGDARPDGICFDSEGCVWIGGLMAEKFVRFRRGGERAGEVGVEGRWAVACVLGGQDRRTLFMATAEVTMDHIVARGMAAREGREVAWPQGKPPRGCIQAIPVETPGAGIP